MTPEILRSRDTRALILQLLDMANSAGVTFGFTFGQICDGFAGKHAPVSDSELRRELLDLSERGLIRFEFDKEMRDNWYRITAKGGDFVKARYPWDKIDEFTGGRA